MCSCVSHEVTDKLLLRRGLRAWLLVKNVFSQFHANTDIWCHLCPGHTSDTGHRQFYLLSCSRQGFLKDV